MIQAGPADMSWRDRRRSRLAEVADGAAMMFADVAVVRATILVAIMLAVAFLARHRSGFAVALAVSAGAFLFAEMINTLVEMLVDRISLEANVFSARIKHAAAFVSACVGLVSVALLAAVVGQVWFGHERPASKAPQGPVGEAPQGSMPARRPVIEAPQGPVGEAPEGPPTPAGGRCRTTTEAASPQLLAVPAGEAGGPPSGTPSLGDPSDRRDPVGGPAEGWPTRLRRSPRSGSLATPSLRSALLQDKEAACPEPAAAPGGMMMPLAPPEFLTRWARSTATLTKPFASRRVLHPLRWEERTRHKKRYRRRRA